MEAEAKAVVPEDLKTGLGTSVTGEDVIDLARVLDPDGVIGDEDIVAYFDVVLNAFQVHVDREAKRHGLWKEYPARDQFFQVKAKTDRVLRMIEHDKSKDAGKLTPDTSDEIVAEAHDIINYAIFGARQA